MYNDVLNYLSIKYDIVSYYENQNSTYGICYKKQNKFFYKSSSYQNIQNELLGHRRATGKIKTAEIEEVINLQNGKSIIVYEYYNGISYNRGLMCDVLNDSTSLFNYSRILGKIIEEYTPNDWKPILLDQCVSYNRFIVERKNTRFNNFYKNVLNQEIVCFTNKLDVKKLIIDINKAIDNVSAIGILSHGDPGDLNIGIEPIFFDLETYGYNPITLEFATFFWNTFLGGAYLFPKYHRQKYIFHNDVFKYSDMIRVAYTHEKSKMTINSGKVVLTEKRIYTLHTIVNLFKDIINKFNIEITDAEIIYVLIYRMLTIVDYSTICIGDRALLCALILVLEKNIGKKPFHSLELILSTIKDGKLKLENL